MGLVSVLNVRQILYINCDSSVQPLAVNVSMMMKLIYFYTGKEN